MAEAQSSINPWVRANLEQPCAETLELIPASLQERYEAVLHELGQAGIALNEANGRFYEAQQARQDFFKGLAY